MPRSSRQPDRKRKKSARVGMAEAIGSFAARNPTLVGGSTAFLVALTYVSANAIWYQPHMHAGAFFSTRGFASDEAMIREPDAPETMIRIERPDATARDATAPRPMPVSDPKVEKVQTVLKDIGIYTGTIDGLMGPNTKKAIEDYRATVGLPQNAGIDDELVEQLGAGDRTAAITPQPAPREKAKLQEQDPKARIMKIQAGLKAFGNDAIEIDGVNGLRTQSAIREFQSLFGLPESGQPDEGVYVKMREIGLTN